MSTAKTYTTAPEDYDGFGTKTLMLAGYYAKGGATCPVTYEPVRLVETPERHVEWQRCRYASGLYLSASLEEFERFKQCGLVVADVPA